MVTQQSLLTLVEYSPITELMKSEFENSGVKYADLNEEEKLKKTD